LSFDEVLVRGFGTSANRYIAEFDRFLFAALLGLYSLFLPIAQVASFILFFLLLVLRFGGGAAVSGLLSRKFLVYLGELSFGFYIFHMLILVNFLAVNRRLVDIEHKGVILVLIFLIAVA
jgi:peptidoglycan/LPS O-acetylase OafA/YrhL